MIDRLSDESFIDKYAGNFFGYGDENAPIWFIGMEEGGGDTYEEVNHRLNEWHNRGCQKLEDLGEFHGAVTGQTGLESISKQPTWDAIARIILSSRGELSNSRSVREFWRSSLGRHESQTCLLELNPLPSPKITAWKYDQFSELSFLSSRESYNARYRKLRIQYLRDMIAQHAPRAVVFYGKRYFPLWAEIANGTFTETDGFSFYRNSKTSFYRINHPVAPFRGKVADTFDRQKTAYLKALGSRLSA